LGGQEYPTLPARTGPAGRLQAPHGLHSSPDRTPRTRGGGVSGKRNLPLACSGPAHPPCTRNESAMHSRPGGKEALQATEMVVKRSFFPSRLPPRARPGLGSPKNPARPGHAACKLDGGDLRLRRTSTDTFCPRRKTGS